MKSYSFTPQGVCAKRITFAIGDDGKLHDVHFDKVKYISQIQFHKK